MVKFREKRTLEYIRGDQLLLEEDRLKAIKNNKPQAYPNVMEAIKERNKKLVSNIRFAFSGNVLEGYVVISKEWNSTAAISAVAGATQWIESALIIAGIQ